MKSTDGGETWTTLETPEQAGLPRESQPTSRRSGGDRDGRIVQQRAVHPRSRRRGRRHSPRRVLWSRRGRNQGPARAVRTTKAPIRTTIAPHRPLETDQRGTTNDPSARARRAHAHAGVRSRQRLPGHRQLDPVPARRRLVRSRSSLARKPRRRRGASRAAAPESGRRRPTPGSAGRSGCCVRTASTSRSSRSGSWARSCCPLIRKHSPDTPRRHQLDGRPLPAPGTARASGRARSSMPRSAKRPRASSTPTTVPTPSSPSPTTSARCSPTSSATDRVFTSRSRSTCARSTGPARRAAGHVVRRELPPRAEPGSHRVPVRRSAAAPRPRPPRAAPAHGDRQLARRGRASTSTPHAGRRSSSAGCPPITPYLERARISVVPLLHGAGVKGKVLQSMMAYTPVVTTPVGAEGLDLVQGEHALDRRDAADLAAGITRLLMDDDALDPRRGRRRRPHRRPAQPRVVVGPLRRRRRAGDAAHGPHRGRRPGRHDGRARHRRRARRRDPPPRSR